MRKLIVLYIFSFVLVPLTAQIVDDFSDGNLIASSIWQGDLDRFMVNSEAQLQLNAETAGEASIFVNGFFEKAMEWSFFVQMDFNPSTSNRARIYLQANESNLLNSSGYFLEIGETGGNDALQFYRQDNGTKVLLGKGTLGRVATSPKANIRAVRSIAGEWQIFADFTGGNDLLLDFTIDDATYDQSGTYFFGFHCKYTATRLTHFFFDNIKITSLGEDLTPPSLSAINVIDEQTITLIFDEPVLESAAINTGNFFINKDIGSPESATLPQPNQIDLTFAQSLRNNEIFLLSINNIEDLKGNVLIAFDTTFLFTKIEIAEPYDLIINEVMEDASLSGGGTLGLPDEEYVELYNRSDKTINLEGFVFTDGSNRVATFPDYLLLPNTYLTIGKTSANTLADFGNFLGLANFPTLSGEETLVLQNEFGETIDVVSYTQDWYGNSTTESGGYALERIDVSNPCLGAVNWQGTTAFLGGTPSAQNSVFGVIADLPLNLIDAYPISPTQIRLTFDKAVDAESLMDRANYRISSHEVIGVSLSTDNFTEVILELTGSLVPNQFETINIATTLEDCLGQPIAGQMTIPIALPVLPSPNDLVINEILFNPQTGGVDFLELFNRSEKVIDLNGLILANQALDNPQIKAVAIPKLVFPNDFIVLTESPNDIQQRYTVQNSTVIFTQDLPTFGDQSGNIQLYTNNGLETIFLDEFDYSDDFHTPLLNDKNGVSLERINPDLPTQDVGNWHSASSSVGYATPTYQNSQLIASNNTSPTIFTLPNNRISPDGDGFEDVLPINYNTPQTGYSATIHIYNAKGQLVDKIAQNELLATEGSFKWEGTTADGQKAPIGIYVLWIEYFNLEGVVERRKEVIVVAGKL